MSYDRYPLSSIRIPGPSLFDSGPSTPDTERHSVVLNPHSSPVQPSIALSLDGTAGNAGTTSRLSPAGHGESSGRSLAAHARTPAAQTQLNEFRTSLHEADRARFDGICCILDHAYDRWRNKADRVDLPAFDNEVAVRIIELTEHGYSAERLEGLEKKAKRLDEWADNVVGGVKSVPFAIASVLTDLLPVLSGGTRVTDPYIKGYIVGSVSAIIDTAGGEALRRAVHDAWWLRVNPGDQTPDLQYNPDTKTVNVSHHPGEMPAVMQKAVENLDADIGLAKKVGQAAISFQSYTARNVARTGISPIASLLVSEKTVSQIDTVVAAVGGIWAGAAAYRGLGHFAHKNGLAGFSALLSRRDYLDRLEQLERANLARQTQNSLVRAAKLPVDMLTDGTDALQSVFRPENLTAELGPLAGGIAAIALAKTKAAAFAAQKNFSTASGLAFTQLAGTLTMIPVLAAWPATSIITNYYKRPAAEFIHQRFHQQPTGVGASGVANSRVASAW
ncbi:hypothetical protein [Pseudomonas sp. GL-B-16]|uniref:hypothetical protein n=1 Tax=Pseudomonas sp. GL-B-16 TaxID=2832373 RepID=UPI001CC0E7F7|nr:hypothetical protein [Pseudomonas sp. GL-B-16]